MLAKLPFWDLLFDGPIAGSIFAEAEEELGSKAPQLSFILEKGQWFNGSRQAGQIFQS